MYTFGNYCDGFHVAFAKNWDQVYYNSNDRVKSENVKVHLYIHN